MNIHITLVAYALPVSPLIAALNGPDTTFHLFRHSNKPEVIADIDSVLDDLSVCYHPVGRNQGLARAWNEGLLESQQQDAEVMLVVNDDVIMSREDLMIMARAAVNNRDAGVIICRGFDGNDGKYKNLDHVVFAVNPIALEKIGAFDENYLVIYGEDVDYSYRAGLAGVPYYNAGDTGIHHLGSSTIKHDLDLNRQNQITFPRNEDYHKTKWGGGYGHEVYRLPFNSENFGWKIPFEIRHAPYPGYNRTDQEIVRI